RSRPSVNSRKNERANVTDALLDLMDDYAHRESALEIVAEADRFALQLRAPYQGLITGIVPPELGVAAMRTLALLVARGPMSQADLVELRGSAAYQHVAELVTKGFVSKHRQPGQRSNWLKVTRKVAQHYDIDRRSALASLSTLDADPPFSDNNGAELP
ncbi:MAG: hypothetical protein HC926_05065, partial [Synechococcaceae cyanobacterium SM2_3_60]|nr:hypothetical protein [Synechococcaceae cyanobacterium SM2_3_60]